MNNSYLQEVMDIYLYISEGCFVNKILGLLIIHQIPSTVSCSTIGQFKIRGWDIRTRNLMKWHPGYWMLEWYWWS